MCLLRTARVLYCAHSFARLRTRSRANGKEICLRIQCMDFTVSAHSAAAATDDFFVVSILSIFSMVAQVATFPLSVCGGGGEGGRPPFLITIL